MRATCVLALFLAFLSLSGCVSETIRADGRAVEEKPASTGPSPLEIAEQKVRRLIDRLGTVQGGERVQTMQEIQAYHEIALGPITEALETANPEIRGNLVYILGAIGGADAHQIVSSRVKDPDPVVRYEAAAALLGFKDWGGVPILIGFLSDQDRRMRYKSFQALRDFTKQDLGYDFGGNEEERAAAVSRWSKWWQQRRAELVYKS